MHTFNLPVFEIATRSAQPELFKVTFGIDRDQFASELEQCLEDPALLPAMSIAVSWDIEFMDETGDIIWKASKVGDGESAPAADAIPRSIEAYLIVQRLLAECGDAVTLFPGAIEISGRSQPRANS